MQQGNGCTLILGLVHDKIMSVWFSRLPTAMMSAKSSTNDVTLIHVGVRLQALYSKRNLPFNQYLRVHVFYFSNTNTKLSHNTDTKPIWRVISEGGVNHHEVLTKFWDHHGLNSEWCYSPLASVFRSDFLLVHNMESVLILVSDDP